MYTHPAAALCELSRNFTLLCRESCWSSSGKVFIVCRAKTCENERNAGGWYLGKNNFVRKLIKILIIFTLSPRGVSQESQTGIVYLVQLWRGILRGVKNVQPVRQLWGTQKECHSSGIQRTLSWQWSNVPIMDCPSPPFRRNEVYGRNLLNN